MVGWVLVLFAGYLIFVNWSPGVESAILGIAAMLGVIVTVSLHLIAIRFTESLSPGDGITKPLDDEEVKHVSAILSSHLSQMEASADE